LFCIQFDLQKNVNFKMALQIYARILALPELWVFLLNFIIFFVQVLRLKYCIFTDILSGTVSLSHNKAHQTALLKYRRPLPIASK